MKKDPKDMFEPNLDHMNALSKKSSYNRDFSCGKGYSQMMNQRPKFQNAFAMIQSSNHLWLKDQNF